MLLVMLIEFTLTHRRHLDLAVDGVRDKPAIGKNEDLHVGDK